MSSNMQKIGSSSCPTFKAIGAVEVSQAPKSESSLRALSSPFSDNNSSSNAKQQRSDAADSVNAENIHTMSKSSSQHQQNNAPRSELFLKLMSAPAPAAANRAVFVKGSSVFVNGIEVPVEHIVEATVQMEKWDRYVEGSFSGFRGPRSTGASKLCVSFASQRR